MYRKRLLISGATFAVAIGGFAFTGNAQPVAAATGTIWVQTLDSCSNALGGATYELAGPGGTVNVVTPPSAPSSVGTCPLQGGPLEQGNCSTTTRGCVSIDVADLTPGVYTLQETSTPPANATNPGGYAPCEGGSACQSEVVKVTIGDGGSASGVDTSIYPDDTTTTSPTYPGTTTDPIVWHDYGLGTVTCPSDPSDSVADQNTGTASSHCAYKPDSASSTCMAEGNPFPWSCSLVNATQESPDDLFITRLYSQVLGRNPLASELSYWTGQMALGETRGSIGYFFLDSTEYHEKVVQADYELMVGRAADPAGLAFWTQQLNNGAYNENVLAGFAGTPEYFQVNGDTNAGFVESLYTKILGDPGNSGASYWVGLLNNGASTGSVASHFTNSHEYHMEEVASWYPKFLGRATDPAGQLYWADYLDNGGRDETIEAGIIGSPEYFNDAQS